MGVSLTPSGRGPVYAFGCLRRAYVYALTRCDPHPLRSVPALSVEQTDLLYPLVIAGN